MGSENGKQTQTVLRQREAQEHEAAARYGAETIAARETRERAATASTLQQQLRERGLCIVEMRALADAFGVASLHEYVQHTDPKRPTRCARCRYPATHLVHTAGAS